MQTPEVLVDRGVRLFQFLARAQQLRAASTPTTERYERDGAVHWLSRFAAHDAIRVAACGDTRQEPDDATVVSIRRILKVTPPALPDKIVGWVEGDLTSAKEPILRDRRPLSETDQDPAVGDAQGFEHLDDRPDVQAVFDAWLADWRAWAEKEKADRPARDLYEKLFRTHMAAVQHGEEMELVLGAGLLSWNPDGGKPVSRHVFTVPVIGAIDDQSGSITFTTDSSAIGVAVELDMLDPSLVPEGSAVTALAHAGAEFALSLLDPVAVGEMARTFVNRLAPTGRYDESPDRPGLSVDPVITWAPALILRPRPNTGLVAAFEQIAAEIEESKHVPEGLRPLLDPDQTPPSQPDPSPGAVLHVDGEVFSPLPLNQRQRDIIERVDRHAQTIVQGPPGTGKTHTAAALLSHLLAQGKRVLVTAHTDRALGEVRNKLPAQVRPLAVSVIGSSRSDMADLKVAVETIGRRSVEHDHAEARRSIEEALADVEQLRVRRKVLAEQLVALRERETHVMTYGDQRGTLAQIAQQWLANAAEFAWIGPLVDAAPESEPPLAGVDAARWRRMLLDPRLRDEADEARRRHVDRYGLMGPKDFSQAVSDLEDAEALAATHAPAAQHPAVPALRTTPAELRATLARALQDICLAMKGARLYSGAWVEGAVTDIRGGFAHAWVDRAQAIDDLVTRITDGIERSGYGTTVEISGDQGPLRALAAKLHEHVTVSGPLKVAPDGTPKIGMFAPGLVKASRPLFEQVRVGGVPPTSRGHLEAVMAYIDNQQLLDELDRAWPEGATSAGEDTFRERLSWHVTQLRQLETVVAIAQHMTEGGALLRDSAIAAPDWRDDNDIDAMLEAIALVDAEARVLETRAPLDALAARLRDDISLDNVADVDAALATAAARRDTGAYATAWAHLDHLETIAAMLLERGDLAADLWDQAPRLAQAVTDTPDDDVWDTRLTRLEQAWGWASTGAWITAQKSLDDKSLQGEIKLIEQRILTNAEIVAAQRAWSHAVGPDRLTPSARADLTQYAQLVRRLGKGTGKYATQQRAEIKQAMDRCRPAVPVWILPIYRIADQLKIEQNMFDVVLIDEASQAGLEATFLQYLAPKIVVIGDDKQVSPSAVGVEQEPLRKLADQYLSDDRYKASWQDPKRSLFDDALMRFGGQITLIEHRRCVPEIIGFSNRIAYEPDNIRLLPVRQFGADRLTPLHMVHVPAALMEGASGNRVNRAEARALVNTLKNCLTDPRYDGKTFGVVSLTGRRQAQLIESMLLSEVSAEEWAARDLRVGDASDFQGSERHVMFLSMVAVAEPGQRLAALTAEMYVQRYNVAVSRAQDQLWLFHSVTLDQLPRKDDMRHQLLAYCEEVVAHGPDMAAAPSRLVPEGGRVEPFDSLFEQRVYNRVAERGYSVVPQVAEQGYRIDLVVVGAATRLAVECDGDAWHGPDAYQHDLARQRELERCGWTFCRIRESEFYVDRHAAMRRIWAALDELDIRPYVRTEAEVDPLPAESPAAATAPGRAGSEPKERGAGSPASQPAPSETELGLQPQGEPDFGVGGVPEPLDVAPPIERCDMAPASTADIARPLGEGVVDSPNASTAQRLGGAPSVESGGRLESYVEFTGVVPAVADASRKDLIDALISIINVEGPVLGERLRSVYVTHSGGQKVGRATAQTIDHALHEAVLAGLIVRENPLHEAGLSGAEFRLAGQPRVRPRTLGPRILDHVPPSEVAHLVAQVMETAPERELSDVYRVVLARLGRRALTSAARARFERIVDELLAEELAQWAAAAGRRSPVSGHDVPPDAIDEEDAMRAILEMAAVQGRVARSDVMNAIGIEPAKATALLGELSARGELERRGERRGSHYVLPGEPLPTV